MKPQSTALGRPVTIIGGVGVCVCGGGGVNRFYLINNTWRVSPDKLSSALYFLKRSDIPLSQIFTSDAFDGEFRLISLHSPWPGLKDMTPSSLSL